MKSLVIAATALIAASPALAQTAEPVEPPASAYVTEADPVVGGKAETEAMADVDTNLPGRNLVSADGQLLAAIESIEPDTDGLSRMTLLLIDEFDIETDRIVLRANLPQDQDGDIAVKMDKAEFIAAIRNGMDVYPDGLFN